MQTRFWIPFFIKFWTSALILFDMGFFLTVSHGGRGHEGPHHNFVIVAPMIIKFGTAIKLDVFYTVVTKLSDVTTITSL